MFPCSCCAGTRMFAPVPQHSNSGLRLHRAQWLCKPASSNSPVATTDEGHRFLFVGQLLIPAALVPPHVAPRHRAGSCSCVRTWGGSGQDWGSQRAQPGNAIGQQNIIQQLRLFGIVIISQLIAASAVSLHPSDNYFHSLLNSVLSTPQHSELHQ